MPSNGPLETGVRTFTVFCDRAFYEVNRITIVQVPLVDPLFAVRSQLDSLRNALQLDRPIVFENPVVDTYGGLITRYPTWLAIEPGAWRTQRGNSIVYRGATLLLIAQPREMDFVVEFTPNPDKPSAPFRGIVSCVPGESTDAGGGALPAFPVLPDQTEPGVNGACTWTPPGPGEVTHHRTHHVLDHVLGERLHRTRRRLRLVERPHHLRHRRTDRRQHQTLIAFDHFRVTTTRQRPNAPDLDERLVAPASM